MFLIHKTYLEQTVVLTYSASIIEVATDFCLTEL